MADVTVTETTTVQSLTDQLTEVLSYLVDLQKGYTDNKVQAEVEKYNEELGKTRDDLKALVDALDALDFKEDGEIDAAVITAKVAENAAAVEVVKAEAATVKSDIENIKNLLDNESLNSEDITSIKQDINTLKSSVESLTQKAEDIATRVQNTETDIENMKLDITQLKANVGKLF